MRIKYPIAVTVALLAGCSSVKQVKKVDRGDEIYAAARQRAIDKLMENFDEVRFQFDSALIAPASRAALAENVQIMRRFLELEVEVQGHCDERGTVEYNLALGERRARAIKKYMVMAGLGPQRIKTISFGEEFPRAPGHDTLSWSKNRRAEFRITVGPHPKVRGTVAWLDYFEDPFASR